MCFPFLEMVDRPSILYASFPAFDCGVLQVSTSDPIRIHMSFLRYEIRRNLLIIWPITFRNPMRFESRRCQINVDLLNSVPCTRISCQLGKGKCRETYNSFHRELDFRPSNASAHTQPQHDRLRPKQPCPYGWWDENAS